MTLVCCSAGGDFDSKILFIVNKRKVEFFESLRV